MHLDPRSAQRGHRHRGVVRARSLCRPLGSGQLPGRCEHGDDRRDRIAFDGTDVSAGGHESTEPGGETSCAVDERSDDSSADDVGFRRH